MDLRRLGSAGIRVSELCLGTMTFGTEADEETSRALVDRYLDAGGNFIDTADIYSGGASEEIVGRALRGRRDAVVLATKGRLPMGIAAGAAARANDHGTSRRHLTRALEQSLRRLSTDWIDLYQVHWPDPNTTHEETLSKAKELMLASHPSMRCCVNHLRRSRRLVRPPR